MRRYGLKPENCPDIRGMIFKRTYTDAWNKTTVKYWKGHKDAQNGYIRSDPQYNLINCSKKGKEYSSCSMFAAGDIMDLLESGESSIEFYDGKLIIELISMNSEIGLKANIEEGIKSGVRKRRISTLRCWISNFSEELENLLEEEND